MSYIDKNLMDSERVLYRTKLHWMVFLWPTVMLIIATLFLCLGGILPSYGCAIALLSFLMFISSFVNLKTTEFALTNKRVIAKSGFIRRDSLEVLLNKIEGIQVNQGILGRIFGYGSVVISGTGGTRDPFHKIDSPLEFRRKVQEQIAVGQD